MSQGSRGLYFSFGAYNWFLQHEQFLFALFRELEDYRYVSALSPVFLCKTCTHLFFSSLSYAVAHQNNQKSRQCIFLVYLLKNQRGWTLWGFQRYSTKDPASYGTGLNSPVGNAHLKLSNNLELCQSSCMADGRPPVCACYFSREPVPPCRNKQNWHFVMETKNYGDLQPLVWVQAGFWLQLTVPCGSQWQLSLSVPIRKAASALHRPEFTATTHWNFVVYFFSLSVYKAET